MAAGGEVVAKYVGHKISKARWSPPRPGSLQPSDTFTTGGWDDQVNKLCVWKAEDIPEESGRPTSGVPNEPVLMCEAEHVGDVTDIQYIDADRILVSSSNGSVALYRYNTKYKIIQPEQAWPSIHSHSSQNCPCTCMATCTTTPDIITAGEDGRVNMLRVDHTHPLRTIESADSTTINGVTFTSASEVAAVSFSGQVKLWDLRQGSNRPTRTMLLSGDRVPLLCVDKHPTQSHLLAAGGQDGVLSIWDLRQEQYPVTLLEGHSAELWEVKFHPQKPDHLFTCSEEGSLWQWDGTSMGSTKSLPTRSTLNPSHGLTNGVPEATASPWLSVDATKHRMETYSLLADNRLSINCLDIESKHLLCGSDCEAIFIIRDLILR